MITASAKSKGRRLQQYVRDSILTIFQDELTPADVSSNPMGCAGCDVVLSTRARELFPYAVECKNCEAWTIPSWWANIKDEIARIVDIDGICITSCWNSNGIGKSRGFEIEEVLLVAHGGWHNDTIVTVERKIKNMS